MEPGGENVAAPSARALLSRRQVNASVLVNYVVIGKCQYEVVGHDDLHVAITTLTSGALEADISNPRVGR